MASQSITTKLGLSLTHIRLRVSKIQEVVTFYTERFGMKTIATSVDEKTQEVVHILGFTGTEGVKTDRRGAFLELLSAEAGCGEKHRNYGKSDSVYWKVGICLPDVDTAHSLLTQGGVKVTQPAQIRDIGYMCHLQDPSAFSMEILQFYMQGSSQPYRTLEDHPLRQQPLLGMVTLRVRDTQTSLRFYRDRLGMRLICTQDISAFGFHLYFLAFTEESPPNPDDLGAVENREWTYQRPYTVLELQAHVSPLEGVVYQEMQADCCGFLGLGIGAINIQDTRAYLVQQELQPTEISEDSVLCTPSFTVKDPDGTPLRISQF